MKAKHIVIKVVLIAIPIYVVLSFAWDAGLGSKPIYTRQMTSYLRKKYGQQFKVQGTKLEGSGLGVLGEWKSSAFPINDPTLHFEISKQQTDLGTKNMYDTYLNELWQRQFKPQFDIFVQENFQHVVRATANVQADRKFYKTVAGRTPSLAETRVASPKSVGFSLYVLSGTYATGGQQSESNLQEALGMVQFAQSLAPSPTNIYYSFEDDIKDVVYGSPKKYWIDIPSNKLSTITSKSDLSPFVKTSK